ncbi:MAG: DUF3857 domain-containing protein [Flavobacteriales bacterium]|nr:DUF3857 domain-containing protein [Flavobacteriales bacterium]
MKYFFLFWLFLPILCFANKDVKKDILPIWVNEITVDKNQIYEESGGFQYLLLDVQENWVEKSVYRHCVVKIINSEGVQSMSDINISFDPSFQELTFHQLNVLRGKETIDHLKKSEIKVFQREENLDRLIYDGSLSSVINLKDVREGDVIEYSYSIKGFNPVHKNNFSTTFYLQFTFPVNKVYSRLIVNKNQKINYKRYNNAIQPKLVQKEKYKEYIFEVSAINPEIYDKNTPSWYDSQERVSFTTYLSWKELINEMLPLFEYKESEILEIIEELDVSNKAISKEDLILKLIRFVQDEVRYLGFESGISAYKPNSPQKVYKQRYGDCKDKSLLLVGLLNSQGITSYPLLVNTTLKNQIEKELPSFDVFNHCIVYFKYKNEEYFIDPTISNQGGNLSYLSDLNYGKGLLLRPFQTELVNIHLKNNSSVVIKEIITLKSIGGKAEMLVRSEYLGAKADYIRNYFNTNSKELIKKEYLNFYSALYPAIEHVDDIKIYDDNRFSNNLIITEEFYDIDDFWIDKDEKTIYCETYPLIIESQVNYPKSPKRTMPYYLGLPYKLSQTTTVYLPEDWNISNEQMTIKGDGFEYENIVQKFEKYFSVTHNYYLKKEFIPSKSVDSFLKKHLDIKNQLSFILTHNKSVSTFQFSWLVLFIMILIICLGVFLCVFLYKRYNPLPYELATNKNIGGWLILPAIGLIFSPLVFLVSFFSQGYFNSGSWDVIFDKSWGLGIFYGVEMIFNLLLLCYLILLLILFFKRRTSLPKFITIYYIIGFVIPLVDLIFYNLFTNDINMQSDIDESISQIFRAFIGGAIWIPYFNISERVKNTFCIQYTGKR